MGEKLAKAVDLLLDYALGFVALHPGLVVIGIIGWVFESLVASSLPTPDDIWPPGRVRSDSFFIYKGLFTAAHLLAMSPARVWATLRAKP